MASYVEPAHISEETAIKYILGHFSEPDLPVIEEHLLSCVSCQEELQTTELLVRTFRRETTGGDVAA